MPFWFLIRGPSARHHRAAGRRLPRWLRCLRAPPPPPFIFVYMSVLKRLGVTWFSGGVLLLTQSLVLHSSGSGARGHH